MELTERENKGELLKELQDHLGWRIYLALLDKLIQRKEKEKSGALRQAEFNNALAIQGVIDGIHLVTREIHNYMTRLDSSEPETE